MADYHYINNKALFFPTQPQYVMKSKASFRAVFGQSINLALKHHKGRSDDGS